MTNPISRSHYMHTSFRPDREYIDGELRERNVGLYPHGRTMALLGVWFASHEEEWGVMTALSLRVQVSPTRVRVPDVVLSTNVDTPPVLVVEVIDPKDTYSDIQQRITEYRGFGVGVVWLIDPATRTGRWCVGKACPTAERLEVPGTPIWVDLSTLFADF